MESETDLITMQEAADICRLKGVWMIRNAIRRRELPAFRMSHRHILIPRAAFNKWMQAKRFRRIEGDEGTVE
jgi:excisionase family DNA binding protein